MKVNKLETYKWGKDEIEKNIGRRIWVCQYTTKQGASQPIKNIEPGLYEICENKAFSKTGKTIYYSDVHLRRVLKNGTISKTMTPIYDNTGWKTNPGNPVFFSTQEKPIRDKYSELLENAIDIHKKEISIIQEQINQLKHKQYRYGSKES